jgi:hypothetical protein
MGRKRREEKKARKGRRENRAEERKNIGSFDVGRKSIEPNPHFRLKGVSSTVSDAAWNVSKEVGGRV